MSILLTPVALICPIFSNAFPSQEQCGVPSEARSIHQEQAVCRIHKQSSGVTDISVGAQNIGIYPIHYVGGDAPYLIFASKVMTLGDIERVQMWTGSADASVISSDKLELDLRTNELSLSKIELDRETHSDGDLLWLSFQHKDQSCNIVQVQLSQA